MGLTPEELMRDAIRLYEKHAAWHEKGVKFLVDHNDGKGPQITPIFGEEEEDPKNEVVSSNTTR